MHRKGIDAGVPGVVYRQNLKVAWVLRDLAIGVAAVSIDGVTVVAVLAGLHKRVTTLRVLAGESTGSGVGVIGAQVALFCVVDDAVSAAGRDRNLAGVFASVAVY